MGPGEIPVQYQKGRQQMRFILILPENTFCKIADQRESLEEAERVAQTLADELAQDVVIFDQTTIEFIYRAQFQA